MVSSSRYATRSQRMLPLGDWINLALCPMPNCTPVSRRCPPFPSKLGLSTCLWRGPHLPDLLIVLDLLQHVLVSFASSRRLHLAKCRPLLACGRHELSGVLSSSPHQQDIQRQVGLSNTSQTRHSSIPTSSVTSYCAPQAMQIIRSLLVLSTGRGASIFLRFASGDVSELASAMALGVRYVDSSVLRLPVHLGSLPGPLYVRCVLPLYSQALLVDRKDRPVSMKGHKT